jgi:hypothetical protein
MPPEAASELLEAGQIMGITIRIGISVGARFRGRNIRFIWVPRGFCDARDFLSFLAEPAVRAFMDEERRVSEYQRDYVVTLLGEFNRTHRPAINAALGVALPPLDPADFLVFVGGGQASILHLAEFIHTHLLPLMEARVSELRGEYAGAAGSERERLEALVARMRELDSEAIVEQYLRPTHNPSLPDPNLPGEGEEVPPLLRLAPHELMLMLDQLHAGYRICLNLSDLNGEDVLEILYDCRGMITHLEIFNLKDHVDGKTASYGEISILQTAINEGNVITLKRLIHTIRRRLEDSARPDAGRIAKLTEILRNIPALQSHYRAVPLGSYIGSDSTGRSLHHYGMGIVLRETLPPQAQKAIRRTMGPTVFTLPVLMTAYLRTTYLPSAGPEDVTSWSPRFFPFLPSLRHAGRQRRHDWEVQDNATQMDRQGNVIPLGGMHEEGGNDLYLEEKPLHAERGGSWRYLNSGLDRKSVV